MDTPVQLVVGLGNPGPQYDRTRHNAGADFVYALAKKYFASLKAESKFFGLTSRITIDGKDVKLLIPTTFMNRSGQAIAAMARFYQIDPEAILVAHDELDLPPGTARFKIGGGHGGHNGLRDTIACLGNNNSFARLRVGIGHPGNAKAVVDYVLKTARKEEQIEIDHSIDNALHALPKAISGDWGGAMQALHTK